jgi:lysophospholipid acyltransferase (LPLAT)-like uncharacterized protein
VKISKKIVRSAIVRSLGCWLLACYIRFIYTTTRWVVVSPNPAINPGVPGIPTLYAFWHGRLFIMPQLFPNSAALKIVVSSHNDGEYIARIMAHFKFDAIRGSTDRGAMRIVRMMIQTLQEGKHIGISPDGPRGPRMRINSNLVAIAQRTGAAIQPVSFSVARCKIFDSWDRFMLPYPFGVGVISYGKAFLVPKEADEAALTLLKTEIENELNRITHAADRQVGITAVMPGDGMARPKKRKLS